MRRLTKRFRKLTYQCHRVVSIREPGSGAPRKNSELTNRILEREMVSNFALTASQLKLKHPALLKEIAISTFQHCLQKNLKLTSWRAANKQLLTNVLKKKRLAFALTTRAGQWSNKWRQCLAMKVRPNSLGVSLKTYGVHVVCRGVTLNIPLSTLNLLWLGKFLVVLQVGEDCTFYPRRKQWEEVITALCDHFLLFWFIHEGDSFFYLRWFTFQQN